MSACSENAASAVQVPVSRPSVGSAPVLPVSTPVAVAASAAAVAADVPFETAPTLDAEKLHVYRLALELQSLAATLGPPHHRVLQDQLERASLSTVCCIAEGAGRRSRRDKRRFYVMSRGSCNETAAIIDVLRIRRLAPEGACNAARALAVRAIQMLTKLIDALG